MENIRKDLAEQFSKISKEDWEREAQKTVKGISLEDLLDIHLTDKVSIRAIYEAVDVKEYYNLQFFPQKTDTANTVSLEHITTLPVEADLELATIAELISRNNIANPEVLVQIDGDFLLSIAKFRALRHILAKELNSPSRIIAVSPNYNKSILDKQNNLVRLTLEAMSATIGGADETRLTQFNSLAENDNFGARITENIKVILDNESHLNRVTDPLAGAYLIENLTSELVKSVASLREELSAISSDNELNEYVRSQAKNYSQSINAQLDSQSRKLIGVNIYQNPNDRLYKEQLNPVSFNSDYEKINAKINELNPKIYIANFGERHSKQAPIVMALNTFNIPFQASGVFELVEDAFNSIKLYDPDLVILNSDDGVQRILKNMLSEYDIASIEDFSDSSMLQNLNTIIEKIKPIS